MARTFEIVNFEVTQFMFMIMPNLDTSPETIYKYYTHGYETYNVFLNLVDLIIIAVIIFILSLIIASKLGKTQR